MVTTDGGKKTETGETEAKAVNMSRSVTSSQPLIAPSKNQLCEKNYEKYDQQDKQVVFLIFLLGSAHVALSFEIKKQNMKTQQKI